MLKTNLLEDSNAAVGLIGIADLAWWNSNSASINLTVPARRVLEGIIDEVGNERQKWNVIFDDLDKTIGRRIKDNQGHLSRLGSHVDFAHVSKMHDETMMTAHAAYRLVNDGRRVLDALRRAKINLASQIASTKNDVNGSWLWRRRSSAKNLASLQQLRDEMLGPDRESLKEQHTTLITNVATLHEQAQTMRTVLKRQPSNVAKQWLIDRQNWLNLSHENWDRARRGLRLRPMPLLQINQKNVRVEGVVKWYDSSKRRGVIQPVYGGPTVQVGRSCLQNTNVLHAGQKVGFVVRETSVGPWAMNVIAVR